MLTATPRCVPVLLSALFLWVALIPRMPNAVDEVKRQIKDCGVKGFKWYTAEWRGQSRGWSANDPAGLPAL